MIAVAEIVFCSKVNPPSKQEIGRIYYGSTITNCLKYIYIDPSITGVQIVTCTWARMCMSAQVENSNWKLE